MPPAPPQTLSRVAAVIGAEGGIGGYTLLLEIRAPSLPSPKDRDFALVLGPVVVTVDEFDGQVDALGGFDWEEARVLAADNTQLRPGDVLGSPPVGTPAIADGAVTLDVAPIGTLGCTIQK